MVQIELRRGLDDFFATGVYFNGSLTGFDRRIRESELVAVAGLHTISMLNTSLLQRSPPPSPTRFSTDRPPTSSSRAPPPVLQVRTDIDFTGRCSILTEILIQL